MHFGNFSFGSVRIDGRPFEHDVVIDRGEIRDRKKKPSKKFRDDLGHTPLSIAEDIPWKCSQLVIGTGAYGRLPVMKEVEREAKRHKVKLLASQGQIADSADNQSHRDIARRPRRHQRDHPRDMLSAAARRYTAARIPCQAVSDLPPTRSV